MGNEQMQNAIKELQEAMIVMAGIEKRRREPVREWNGTPVEASELQQRIEKNLAQITEKLNRQTS